MRDIIELNAGWHLGPGGAAETVFRLPTALRHEAGASLVLSKQFHAPEKWQGQRLILDCRGINRPVSLTINGQRLDALFSAPVFETEIGSFLRYGENNLLELSVAPAPDGVDSCFLRGMRLIVTPSVAFASGGVVAFLLTEGEATVLHIRTCLACADSRKRKTRLTHYFVFPDGKKSKKWAGVCQLPPASEVTFEKTEQLTPPQLARFAGSSLLLRSVLEDENGIIEERDTPVRLRDRRITPRGCLTEEGIAVKRKALYDTSVPLCRPSSDEILQMEYRTWGELGVDTVLLPVDINTDRRLEALDRSGRSAIVALPVRTDDAAQAVYRETIAAFCRHPSVFAWSVGALSGTPEEQERIRAVRETVKNLSPAAFLTAETDLRLPAATAALLDFLILRRDADQLPAVHKKYPSKPLFLLSHDENEFFSLYTSALAKDYCFGLMECAANRNAGFLTESAAIRISLGMPRLRERMQAAFVSPAKAPMAALQPAEVAGSMLAMSNCPQLALWVDGHPLPGVDMQKNPFCTFTPPADFGYLQAIGFYRGREVARVEREALSAPYALTASLVTASGRPDTSGYLFLLCTAVDAEGREVRDAAGDVTVTASGSIAVDDPRFASLQSQCTLTLSDGRAVVPLLRTGEGPFTVRAESPVLMPVQLRV